MKPTLLQVEINGVRLFENNYFKMNFLSDKRVFNDEVEDHIVEKLNKSNYKHNVVAIAGINASGKTTTLRLLNFILEVFVEGNDINEDTSIAELFTEEITITCIFKNEKKQFQVITNIYNQGDDEMSILEEVVTIKNIEKAEAKGKFLLFDSVSESEQMKRSALSKETLQFLKPGDSIFPSILRGGIRLPNNFLLNTFGMTDMNFLSYKMSESSDFDADLITYLDSSIESLKIVTNEEDMKNKSFLETLFELKFKDSEPQIVTVMELNNYLSSGTIRGLSIFARIEDVLQTGGYMLIDEIEIHFNKAIVQSIIRLFQSDVNVNHASLVFSTHYSELLDSILRKDAVKVLRKKGTSIVLDRLSHLAKEKGKDRNDYKNSDMFLSGIFGTAPEYEEYWKVNRKFKKTAMEGTAVE